MKLIFKKWMLAAILISAIITGCKKISDLQKNPNESDQGSPKLILTGIQLDLYDEPWSDYSYIGRQNQSLVLNYDYYGDQSYTWGAGDFYYTTLSSIKRLNIESDKLGANAVTASYKVIGKIMQAWLYSKMSEEMGDIPLSNAIRASEGVYYPKYDTQKDVFKQCLQWTEEANVTLDSIIKKDPNATVEGDIFFDGDLKQWQKAVNSLHLRMLIALSKKADVADLNIKGQFNAIVSNSAKYPVIGKNDDNMKITYNGTDMSNYVPLYPDEKQEYVNSVVLGATWTNILTSLHDPRIFIIASPAKNIADNPLNPFARYTGANTGDLQDDIQVASNDGLYAYINRNFWLKDNTGVPSIQLGVSETAFNIAEGINRGWASGDAAAYYIKGITQSMLFYGVAQSAIDAFLAQPAVAYKGNNANGLNQILTQKYVAFFQNSGWQAYFNQRRTGVPDFEVGPANDNGSIPLRFTYPQSEYTNNGVNVKAAIQSQFNGSDIRNDVIWLLK